MATGGGAVWESLGSQPILFLGELVLCLTAGGSKRFLGFSLPLWSTWSGLHSMVVCVLVERRACITFFFALVAANVVWVFIWAVGWWLGCAVVARSGFVAIPRDFRGDRRRRGVLRWNFSVDVFRALFLFLFLFVDLG